MERGGRYSHHGAHGPVPALSHEGKHTQDAIGHRCGTCSRIPLPTGDRFLRSHHVDWFYLLSHLSAWGAGLGCHAAHPSTRPGGTSAGCTRSPRSPPTHPAWGRCHRARIPPRQCPVRELSVCPSLPDLETAFSTPPRGYAEPTLPTDPGMPLARGGYCPHAIAYVPTPPDPRAQDRPLSSSPASSSHADAAAQGLTSQRREGAPSGEELCPLPQQHTRVPNGPS